MNIKKLSKFTGVFSIGVTAGIILVYQVGSGKNVNTSITQVMPNNMAAHSMTATPLPISATTVINKPQVTDATAQVQPDVVDQARFYDTSAVSNYADDFGITPEEAERRLIRQDDLADRLSEIVTLEGNNIAGWGITHEPVFAGWVSLVSNSVNDNKTQELLNQNSDITVKYGARHSITQLEEAQDVLLNIGSTIGGKDTVSVIPDHITNSLAFVDIDMESNNLVVTIDKNAKAITSGQFNERDLITHTHDYLASHLGVNVHVNADVAMVDQVTLGGGRATSGCTLAFSVKDNKGRKGVITAAHCPDNMPGLNFKRSVYSGKTDAQWHSAKSGTKITNNFQADRKKFITPKTFSKTNRMKGKWICHYGATSGKSCGKVVSINQGALAKHGNHTVRFNLVLVQGRSLRCSPGDSGGPWYSGRVAYGIHKGSIGTSNGEQRCVFSGIDDATKKLGVSILRKG